ARQVRTDETRRAGHECPFHGRGTVAAGPPARGRRPLAASHAIDTSPRAPRTAAAGTSSARRGPCQRFDANRSTERWWSTTARYGCESVLAPWTCTTTPAGAAARRP